MGSSGASSAAAAAAAAAAPANCQAAANGNKISHSSGPDAGRQQQVAFGPTAFAFNSYQDIRVRRSTFAGSFGRFGGVLTPAGQLIRNRAACREPCGDTPPPPRGHNSQKHSRLSPGSKFKLHSNLSFGSSSKLGLRNHSKSDELLEQQNLRGDRELKCCKSELIKPLVCCASCGRNYSPKEIAQSRSHKAINSTSTKMSQTMQSIQSLSLQLNRAASQCDLSSIVVGPFSPGSSLEMTGVAGGTSGGNVTAAGFAPSNGNSPASKLSRLVNKKAVRVKEILLQNLGKADRTTDELFKMYEENFYKQQAQALKLQKEFKSYINALKVSQEADKSLNNCIQQSTSDYQSARHDLVCENLSQMDHLNEDLMDKLRSQVLVSINEYLTHFNELRDKIAKRRRKLIDFDSSRRIYELSLANINRKRQLSQQRKQHQQRSGAPGIEPGMGNNSTLRSFKSALSLSTGGSSNETNQLQSATSQLVDEARLLKLREQYNYCRIMYETINGELHEQLPMVYEKKMKHLLMTLQSYFSIEAQYHSNAGKLFATASDVIDELPMSNLSSHQHHRNHGGLVVTRTTEPEGYNSKASGSSGVGSSRGDSSLESSSSPDASSCSDEQAGKEREEEEEVEVVVVEEDEGPEAEESARQSGDSSKGSVVDSNLEQQLDHPENSEEEEEEEEDGELREEVEDISCDISLQDKDLVDGNPKEEQQEFVVAPEELDGPQPVGIVVTQEEIEVDQSKPEEKEDTLLYKVKTSYKYLAEDVDELCFEADEIIQVIAFDPSQEPEDGWLMGVREVNGQRGLFPANFTHPI